MLYLILLSLAALAIGWFVSELRGSNPGLRIALGILSIAATTFCVSAVNDMLTRFNYNSSYGTATKDLIETSIAQIEDGHLDRVLKVWRATSSQYQPTYENRAGYKELVEAATARIKGDTPIKSGSPWDASEFSKRTWLGHWENDTGYWLIIGDSDTPLGILRSGDPTTKMHSVSLSNDYRVLTFKEGNQWIHSVTLKNKYQASHEWFDVQKQRVWQVEELHKLVRK
jgi:hypothetical protein